MEQRVAVGDDRLVLLAELHRTGLHRTLEGQEALAAFAADAQHAAAPEQPVVCGVEQAVFLQAPSAQRRGADREHPLARVFGAIELELDFAL